MNVNNVFREAEEILLGYDPDDEYAKRLLQILLDIKAEYFRMEQTVIQYLNPEVEPK